MKKTWEKRWYIALALLAGAIALRCALLLAAPFVLALLLAGVFEPPVRALVRRRWKRPAAAAAVTLGALALSAALLFGCAAALMRAAKTLAEQLPVLLAAVTDGLSRLRSLLQALVQEAPEEVQSAFELAITGALSGISSLPGQLSEGLLRAVTLTVQALPGVLLFAVTLFLGMYFCSCSLPKLRALLRRSLPERWERRIHHALFEIRAALKGYLRSQGILTAVNFVLLLGVFALMRVRQPLTLALLTALVDALPVLGTGTVLLPWSLFSLAAGNLSRALLLVSLWAGTNLLRNLLQAKLLGDQIGLSPLGTLIGIYVGWKLGGVWGMIVLPLALAVAVTLFRSGVFRRDT